MSDDGRRTDRRRFVAALGTTVGLAGLAGCSGGNDGEGDGSSDEAEEAETDEPATEPDDGDGQPTTETPEPTETSEGGDNGTPAFVQESMGSVGRDDIEGLDVVAWDSAVADGEFTVRVAVQNTSDQQADARQYTYQIRPFDESGSEIETTGSAVAYPNATQLSPRDVASVHATPTMDADPASVASYEVLLHCDGPFAEGKFCP